MIPIPSQLQVPQSRNCLCSSLLVCWILSVWLFIMAYPYLMWTALLICMENTFWNLSREDGNFMESFKKSFKFYVRSGMMRKTEADIYTLRNVQGGYQVTKSFKETFYNIITKHYLRKIQIFNLHWHSFTIFSEIQLTGTLMMNLVCFLSWSLALYLLLLCCVGFIFQLVLNTFNQTF